MWSSGNVTGASTNVQASGDRDVRLFSDDRGQGYLDGSIAHNVKRSSKGKRVLDAGLRTRRLNSSLNVPPAHAHASCIREHICQCCLRALGRQGLTWAASARGMEGHESMNPCTAVYPDRSQEFGSLCRNIGRMSRVS